MKKIENRDLQQYYKAKKISSDLIDILKAEKPQIGEDLELYVQENSFAEHLKSNLTNSESLKMGIEQFNNPDKGANVDRLIRDINKWKLQKQRRLRKTVISISSVAAAVALVSFLIYNSDNIRVADSALLSQTEKIGTPTLILPNGKKINLNSDEKIISEKYSVDIDKNIVSASVKNKTGFKATKLLNTIVIPSSYIYKVKLSDNSFVTLNAGGKLIYPIEFNEQVREVEIQGEAYFEISKSEKPFIVKVNNVEVKVYGTSFNIKCFRDGSVETVLLRGSVGVKRDGEAEVIIKPNQKMVIDKNGVRRVEDVDALSYVAWIDNNFRYHNKALKSIIEDIENWYNVKVDTEKLDDNVKIDLFIEKSATVDKVFRIIEATTNYKFIKEGGGKYTIN